VQQVAFNLGSLTVYWYGVMVALGCLAGLWTASRRAPLAGIRGEKIMDLGPWLIVGALVGARFVYVVTYWSTLFHDPYFPGAPWTEVFMIRRGGLVYYGGLIGSAATGIFYCWLRELPLWKVADVLSPSIALGYMFGRIGCLLNGCCFGKVCHLPWAIQFPNKSFAWSMHNDAGLVGFQDKSLPVHPTQIYDSLLSRGLYLALAWLFRRRKFDGQIFAAYLMCYAVTRSFVEMFRGDYTAEHIHGGLTPAHLVSLGIFAAGAVLFAVLRKRKVAVK
jgi:phosphatidylglycerol---prolipoprotein diacylglyceryl transferase